MQQRLIDTYMCTAIWRISSKLTITIAAEEKRKEKD